MGQKIWFIILLLGIVMRNNCETQQEQLFKSVEGKVHSAVTPVEQTDEEPAQWWRQRHDAVNDRLKKGNVDILFIGNSIIHGWEDAGRKYWDLYYGKRNAVNVGCGWDRTQHVLWRLNHLNFENISPKLAIVLIGTNNWENTAKEVADGIIKICKKLREKLPMMKILLLAIFPRDHKPSDLRQKNEISSLLVSKISDNQYIYYLDLSSVFLSADGILSEKIFPDYLHPSEKGYKIWAEAMEPVIVELLGESIIKETL